MAKTLLTWCTCKSRGAANRAGGGDRRRERDRDQLQRWFMKQASQLIFCRMAALWLKERGQKNKTKPKDSRSCTWLFKREREGMEESGGGGTGKPIVPRCCWGKMLPATVSTSQKQRVRLWQMKKHEEKKKGCFQLTARRGGEAMQAAPALRAYLLPPVPGERVPPSMPRHREAPRRPEEAGVTATTWEDRIWYKL